MWAFCGENTVIGISPKLLGGGGFGRREREGRGCVQGRFDWRGREIRLAIFGRAGRGLAKCGCSFGN